MNVLDNLVDYSRQGAMDIDIMQVQSRYDHVIIGCGGIGYWLALMLGMMGAQHLVLVDGDRLEESNLNRIPAPVRMNGQFKVTAIKAQLRMLRPGLRITCVPTHITDTTFDLLGNLSTPSRVSVLWDCTDDARIQQKISRYATALRRKYVKLGYDGWKVGLYRHMENMWLPDDYRPGYTSSKANVLSSVIAAALGVMYLGREADNTQDTEIDLRKLVEGGHTE